jgi:hypothetical protein
MKPAEKRPDNVPEKPAPRAREERAESKGEPETIDFAKLDLSIEKVEERIAPSETNVFDK